MKEEVEQVDKQMIDQQKSDVYANIKRAKSAAIK
jgi:hypothetical protein